MRVSLNINQEIETDMALIKYRRPNTDVFSTGFHDIMDELFSNVQTTRDSFVPSIDISETDTSFEILAQVPGISKDDIHINLENSRLTISGERKFEKEENGKKFHRVETQYGSFSRSFQLPDSIDQESIKATYENGILAITISKKEEEAKKQIEIH